MSRVDTSSELLDVGHAQGSREFSVAQRRLAIDQGLRRPVGLAGRPDHRSEQTQLGNRRYAAGTGRSAPPCYRLSSERARCHGDLTRPYPVRLACQCKLEVAGEAHRVGAQVTGIEAQDGAPAGGAAGDFNSAPAIATARDVERQVLFFGQPTPSKIG